MADRSLCLCLGDIHSGKVTESYDLHVMRKRLEEYPDLLFEHPGLPRFVSEVRIFLLGDMVEGSGIYPGQEAVVGASTVDQIGILSELLQGIFSRVVNRWPQIPVVVECVKGNHGRMAKFAHPGSNWDLALYERLQDVLKDDENIVINVTDKEFGVTDVQGLRGIITHEGVPHVETPARARKYAYWLLKHKGDFVLTGHWHHVQVSAEMERWFLTNGALCGTDDSSHRIAHYSIPAQLFFSVSPELGIHSVNWISWK